MDVKCVLQLRSVLQCVAVRCSALQSVAECARGRVMIILITLAFQQGVLIVLNRDLCQFVRACECMCVSFFLRWPGAVDYSAVSRVTLL